jgi:hypothetical protein
MSSCGIAAERAYVYERGGVSIRLEPAAAIVRRYEGAIPVATPQANAGRRNCRYSDQCRLRLALLHRTFATKPALNINRLTFMNKS